MTYNYDEMENIIGQNNELIASIIKALGAFLLVFAIIFLVILIFMIIATCKFYKKAGKGGWEAIIPFYNGWVLVDIAGLNWWWFFIVIGSTLVSLLFNNVSGLETIGFLATMFGFFVCNYNIAKKLHKDTGFAVLLTIFPVIMIPVVAFSKNYQFDHNVELSKNGPF